jgi:hypothetical protein
MKRLRNAFLACATLPANMQDASVSCGARRVGDHRLHRRSSNEAIDALDASCLERPHVRVWHQQRITNPDDSPRRHGQMCGGGFTIHDGAVLAAEIGDDAVPGLERHARMPPRNAAIIDLAGPAVATSQLERPGYWCHDASGRGAVREHDDHAGDLRILASRVAATCTERKGGWFHAGAAPYHR